MFSDVEYYGTINLALIIICTYVVPIAYFPPALIRPTVPSTCAVHSTHSVPSIMGF